MALPLAGKHCAVVGATGIIGFSIAKAFAQQGAVLTLLARSAAEARPRLEPQLRPYSLPGTTTTTTDAGDVGVPAAHRFIPLDVANRESIKAVFGARGSSSKVGGLFFSSHRFVQATRTISVEYKKKI